MVGRHRIGRVQLLLLVAERYIRLLLEVGFRLPQIGDLDDFEQGVAERHLNTPH